MKRGGSSRSQPGLWSAVLTLAVLLALPSSLVYANAAGESGIELTSPVRQQLRLLTEAWRSWTRAFYQVDREAASNALDQMLTISSRLGLSGLPDLSNAAAAFAVSAAREDDFDRASWALEMARRLDESRPETDFAAATVARLSGDTFGALRSTVAGYARLAGLPIARTIWLQDIALWLVYTLILSGGLFVALQMATKGGALLYDLSRFMSPPLDLRVADILTVIALVWPLALPSGLVWLAIYWSVLLWGYGSRSEKTVFIILWLSLGLAPLALSVQQRAVQLTLAPPIRAIDHVTAGRLYGSLFSDIGVLRTLLPEHPVADELVADLHRRFGQWEHARSIYTAMLDESNVTGQEAAAALNNLGVYHHRKGDWGTAVNYFREATRQDPVMTEAHFNLAQAFSQLYKFSDSNLSMARAKELDRARVTAWERREISIEESAVGVDGALRRVPQLRRDLQASWYGAEESATAVVLWRRHFSLSVVAGVILLAFTLHLVRSQLGYRSTLLEPRVLLSPAADRWARAMVPGLKSARAERGGKALLALLVPVALVVVALPVGWGYRAPLAFDPGSGLQMMLAVGGLVIFFLVRLRIEARS
ncbi:MAG: tetratricopeptide repeat protein [Acidobacteriota bacterium]